jgi:hypothetical protein
MRQPEKDSLSYPQSDTPLGGSALEGEHEGEPRQLCQSCGQPAREVFEIQGYLGTYVECEKCFGGEEEADVS